MSPKRKRAQIQPPTNELRCRRLRSKSELKLMHDTQGIAERFVIEGKFMSAEPHGNGHINDTYRVTFEQTGTPIRYILQRINRQIFTNPAALTENMQRVTAHLASKIAGQPDADRRVLRLVPTHSGDASHVDEQGNHWRVFRYIEGARTYNSVTSAAQAFEAAMAFGQFQRLLSDLPAPRLHEVIPDFHHTPKRLAGLERAIAADAAGRARLAKPEIAFALAHRSIASLLLEANLPERVTHNDTKINNVMLDDLTGEGICVVDLDTVMPGLALYDFGDLVRSTTCSAREDDRDPSKVRMEFPMFEALVRGYLATAGEFLTKGEIAHLAVSGQVITYETGVRFLTDYLSGDTYFKVDREGHNLDRCRTQFRLVESIAMQTERMQRFVLSL